MSTSSSSSSCGRNMASTLSSDDFENQLCKKKTVGCRVGGMCAPAGNRVKLLVLCGVLSGATNFPEGYCNSYPNTSHMTFQTMINGSYIERGMEGGLSEGVFTWYWSLVLNIWFIGYLLGTFVTPYFTDNLGRKQALLISNVVALIGAILSLVSTIWEVPEVFLVSRFVSSISSGISFGALILFLQEATPTEERGITSFLCETTFIFMTALGIAFGMDVIFGQNLIILTGVAIIPAGVAIAAVLPLHETPKFLLINGNDREAALDSLHFYRGVKEENEDVLEEMMLEAAMGAEEKFRMHYDMKTYMISMFRGMKEVLTTGHLRIAFLLGSACLQIILGIWPILYFSTDLLEGNFTAEIAQLASLAFIMADFIAAIGGMFIIEKFGRRSLLISLGIANTASLLLFALADLLIPVWEPIRWGQILALMMFGTTYGVALGPIAFFITSELVPQRSRSIVQSMVFGFNTIMNFILSFIMLPCYNAIGAYSFLILLVIPSCGCIVFLVFYLPETRGREVHDVVDQLMARHTKCALPDRTVNIATVAQNFVLGTEGKGRTSTQQSE